MDIFMMHKPLLFLADCRNKKVLKRERNWKFRKGFGEKRYEQNFNEITFSLLKVINLDANFTISALKIQFFLIWCLFNSSDLGNEFKVAIDYSYS